MVEQIISLSFVIMSNKEINQSLCKMYWCYVRVNPTYKVFSKTRLKKCDIFKTHCQNKANGRL